MKNEAEHRIRYYGFVSYPVFSENFRNNDYLCREVFQEKLRFLAVENVFGGRAKVFSHPYFGLISDPKKATDK